MIDVIIPVKNRPEVERCIESLIHLPQIKQILICDGGSQTSHSHVLEKIRHWPKVKILDFPMPGFNKSYLMNQGILCASAEFVLMSDADIVWNGDTLNLLFQSVKSDEKRICSISQVIETQPGTIALKRTRYTYSMIQNQDKAIVIIQNATEGNHRPGCGLLFTRRSTLVALGGYKEFFCGWGWEDQDLLMRAQLLGISIDSVGHVIHLSHADEKRNSLHDEIPPSVTRNRNILIAVNSLLRGELWGDLPLLSNELTFPRKIQAHIPEDLRTWLNEFCCEGIADHDLSWARQTFENADGLVAIPIPRSTDSI
jgi:glycosyltransferase involved in cell wall biosynthesis